MLLDSGVEVTGLYCSAVDVTNTAIFILIFKTINQKHCFITGYFCRSGAYVSTPEGFAENATLCPPGTFNYSDAGPCPAGFYCPVGTAEPEKCPPGTFSNETKLSSVEQCQNCTAGRYCGEFNLVKPSGLCREGYYCPSGASRPDWIECPAGAYCVNGTFEPELCPNGTFRNITKGMSIEDCFSCTPGYYCQGVGLTKVTGPCAERYSLFLCLSQLHYNPFYIIPV